MPREKLSFFIIDDDPGDIEILRRNVQAIDGLQADIDCASTPMSAKALRTCRNIGEADVVFVDYHLGGVTGLEVFSMLREAGFKQPMIMLTGRGNETVAVEAMKAGFTDYLVKDAISPVALSKVIINALEKAALIRQIEAQQKKLEELARIDVLTGLYNRRYFLECLITEVHRAIRYRQGCAVLSLISTILNP
jgi:PleD family two-component response regulator